MAKHTDATGIHAYSKVLVPETPIECLARYNAEMDGLDESPAWHHRTGDRDAVDALIASVTAHWGVEKPAFALDLAMHVLRALEHEPRLLRLLARAVVDEALLALEREPKLAERLAAQMVVVLRKALKGGGT